MKLENQVCSLDLAKRLKELGVKQESLYVWQKSYFIMDEKTLEESDSWRITSNPKNILRAAIVKPWDAALRKLEDNSYSAFTVAELGEMLPPHAYSIKGKERFICRWWGEADEQDILRGATTQGYQCDADTEADARAKMLIYLLENNLTHPTQGDNH